jgi:hypothetical protein
MLLTECHLHTNNQVFTSTSLELPSLFATHSSIFARSEHPRGSRGKNDKSSRGIHDGVDDTRNRHRRLCDKVTSSSIVKLEAIGNAPPSPMLKLTKISSEHPLLGKLSYMKTVPRQGSR